MEKVYLMISLAAIIASHLAGQTAKKTVVEVVDLRGSDISDYQAKFLIDRLVVEF